MVTFVIVRHGCTWCNKEKVYTGQMDVPLEELGVWQAQRAAEYILKHFKIDAIYSSDLTRAINTARPLAEALQLPIHTDSDLREIYLGSWQGRLIEEVRKEKEYALWSEGIIKDSEKENHEQLLVRAKRAFQRIAEENEDKCIMIATHGGIVNCLIRAWLGAEKTKNMKLPGNASVTVVNYDAKTEDAEILVMGFEGHLVCLQ